MPLLHYFNPGHETAVLNGSPYYMPPASVLQMQHDLAFLPAWYAAPCDFVLTEFPVAPLFIQWLTGRFGPFAKPVTRQEASHNTRRFPPATAAPWGLSPQSLHVYRQVQQESGWPLTLPAYDDTYARLCGRQTAALCLRALLPVLPQPARDLVPCFRSSLPEIEEILLSCRRPLLLKAPYSSSGRGLRWVNGALNIPDKQWISGILKKQGNVSIEPVLDKQVDFAMEFYSDGEGNVRYEGLSLFNTGTQGNYTGNFIGQQEEIEQYLASFIDINLLEEIKEALAYTLQDMVGYLYKGYLGIDMLVYKDTTHRLRLHPCVEINMRYTMGLTAIHISRRVLAAGSRGSFKIEFHADAKEAFRQHLTRQERYPQQIREGKLISGYLPLCEVREHSHYTAYIIAGNT